MAYEESLVCIGTLTAAVDLSSYQYCAVKMSASGTVTFCSAATDIPIGVLQNKPTAGQAATVAISGVTKLKAGASVTFGNKLTSTSVGKGTPSTTATNCVIGIALETVSLAATPAGSELVSVLLAGPLSYAANAS